MKKYIISIFLYIGDDPTPILLAEQKYDEFDYKLALRFIDKQFENEDRIVVASKEDK